MRSWLPLLFALAIATFGALHASMSPPVRPANAPADAFSAARAMADVREIGRAPHPAGSVAHARVRDRLIARMAELGLAPRLSASPGVRVEEKPGGSAVSGAIAENIVGVRRGRDARLPAVLLMAHYDSVPASPGAADDGAGIAAALEVARALGAGGVGARDLILLFTDAEENGLLGARAFLANDVAARRVGFVVNMDMRGGGGRAIMHETGHVAGATIALYRRTAVHPTTDSIAAWVERLIRNSSDFRVTADHGLPGLNYAILDRQFDYHAASSTPERLDPRSLQHLGEQVLAVTRAAVDDPGVRPPVLAEPAYASVLGTVVIAYPAWSGWIADAGALLLAGIAWRRNRPEGTPRAVLAAMHLALTLPLALMLARGATGIPFGFAAGRPLLAWWGLYETALGLICAAGLLLWHHALRAGAWRGAIVPPLLLLAGLLATGAGGWITTALAVVAALIARPAFATRTAGAAVGYGLFAVVAMLAVAVQVFAPVATPSLHWALLGGAVVLLLADRGWRLALPMLVVVGGLLVAQQAATAHLLLLAVGESMAAVAAPFALFASLALAPLMARAIDARAAMVGGAVLATGAAGAAGLIAVIRFVDPASSATPRISQVIHVSDLASGRFYRVTSLIPPDRWTRAALGPAGETPLIPVFDKALVARGEPVRSAPPRVLLGRLGDGRVLLTVAGPPGTRQIRMALATTAAMGSTTLNGMATPLMARAGRIDRVNWVGRDQVLTLLCAPRGHGRLVARVAFLVDGWPTGARALPGRPLDTMPWYDSDDHLMIDTVQIVW